MRDRSLILAAAVVGLVLGPALDQIHVRTGALAYAHPDWLDQAWWVAPQFAVAFAAIAAGSLAILRRATPSGVGPVPPAGYVAWCLVAFIAAYAVTGLLHEREWLVVGILGAGFLLRLAFERPGPGGWLVLALLVVGGSTYESILSSFDGTFSYADASLGPIPAWLPLLYAHGAHAVLGTLRAARD